MKTSDSMSTPRSLIIIWMALFAFAALPLLSSARSPSTSVNIVNNSSREIRNVYLSHVDVDDWSNDQLSAGATIAPGQSYNLGDVACDQQQVKVIAEDQDGCFASTLLTCGSSTSWTITNDTPRDCGGN